MLTPKVILVHGFNKDDRDMSYLEESFKQAGYFAHSVRLPTLFGSLDAAVKSLRLQILLESLDNESVAFVAHSMGGLIVREYIKTYSPKNISSCVFIATPHRGSALADIADKIPFYSKVFRPIKALKTNGTSVALEKDRSYKIGVIAGNKCTDILGKTLLQRESDGRVEVEATKYDDLDEHIVLPFNHQEIHHKAETFENVKHFIESFSFLAKPNE